MRYVYPYYYKEFECIGGGCPDTCCAGWDVDVDDDTAYMYRAIPLPIGKKLREKLLGSEGSYHFRLTPDKRCPFLNEKNLCELILALGDGGMCVTCTEYPRFYADTPIYEQVDLTLSCPEAARIFFRDSQPVTYITEDIDESGKEDEGEFGDDPFGHEGDSYDEEEFEKEVEESDMAPADRERLLNILLIRDKAIEVMQDRSLSLEEKWARALKMILSLDDGESQDMAGAGAFEKKESENAGDGYDLSLTDDADDDRILSNIKEMETVNPLWDTYMGSVRDNLDKVRENVSLILAERSHYLDCQLERFLTYLIFRYVIDIYYKKSAGNNILFMKSCFRILLLLLGQNFVEENDSISATKEKIKDTMSSDDKVREILEERARIFSRQIEHSDDNVSILLKSAVEI